MAEASTSSPGEYRVLARKYRPAAFAELIGQDAMVKTLANAIETGRLAHAFLLTGVRGVGKTTTARLIAKALNCDSGPTVTPCGACSHCQAIAESRHVDVLEMDAASRTGVDDIREIIDSVRYSGDARYKIYIIDEVHMLSKNAFNALLKTLEEPPDHVKFIFATTEVRKLPVTVLSRCQRFDLRRVEADVLIAHFKAIAEKEEAKIEDGALALIARAAEGSVRDGLSLLDQAIAHGAGEVSEEQIRAMLGLADRARVLDLLQAVLAGEVAKALDEFKAQYDLGADPGTVLKAMLEAVHWLTRLKVVADAGSDALVSEAERKQGAEMAGTLAMAHLTRAWQLLMKGLGEVRAAPAPLAAAEMVLIRLAYAAGLPTPAEAIASLSGGEPAKPAPPSAPKGNGNPGIQGAPRSEPAPAQPADGQPVAEAPSGSGVLALKTEPRPTGTDPVPADFRGLVELFQAKREGIIAANLHDNVRLVQYRPGFLAFNPVRRIPVDLASRAMQCLRDWTGQDWQIVIASDEGQATLQEEDEAAKRALKQRALETPLVQQALEAFPGAELVDVEDRLAPSDQEGDEEKGTDP